MKSPWTAIQVFNFSCLWHPLTGPLLDSCRQMRVWAWPCDPDPGSAQMNTEDCTQPNAPQLTPSAPPSPFSAPETTEKGSVEASISPPTYEEAMGNTATDAEKGGKNWMWRMMCWTQICVDIKLHTFPRCPKHTEEKIGYVSHRLKSKCVCLLQS